MPADSSSADAPQSPALPFMADPMESLALPASLSPLPAKAKSIAIIASASRMPHPYSAQVQPNAGRRGASSDHVMDCVQAVPLDRCDDFLTLML